MCGIAPDWQSHWRSWQILFLHELPYVLHQMQLWSDYHLGFLRDGGELSRRADPGCKCPPPPNTGFQVYSRKQLKLHLHQKQENPGLITGKVAFAFPGASHCQVLFLRGGKCFCSLTKSTFFFFSLSLKILCGQREPATQSVFKGNLGNLRFPESGCS